MNRFNERGPCGPANCFVATSPTSATTGESPGACQFGTHDTHSASDEQATECRLC
jgi:hypothetical protein